MRRKADPLTVLYVAGPYRAATEYGVTENIRRAEAMTAELLRLGVAPICPHKNTAGLGGVVPDEVILRAGLELVRRADGVVLVDGWEHSDGTAAEIELARQSGKRVFESVEAVRRWMTDGQGRKRRLARPA